MAPTSDNVLRCGVERFAWESGVNCEDLRQPPYHQLVISQQHPRSSLAFEVRCPFPTDDNGDHLDVYYCSMLDSWPSIVLAGGGATLEMQWHANAMCFVCWEAANVGVSYLLDVAGRVPLWARTPGTVDVILESYGRLEDFTLWLVPVDRALAALE